MAATKKEILQQLQHDNFMYAQWSDALKEVLQTEMLLVRQPADRNERTPRQPYIVHAAHAV